MILIVDDDPAQRRMTGAMLSAANRPWGEAESGAAALEMLAAGGDAEVDLLILDLGMPDMDGAEVLRRLRAAGAGQPALMLTGEGSIANAVETMRAGATDFLVKPVSSDRLEAAIRRALKPRGGDQRAYRRDAVKTGAANKRGAADGFAAMVARAPATQVAIATARKAAASSIPILIEGESGVGKEVFARAIHAGSGRADGPFVAVNCGALPANLVESILFGHEKGAFTGAVARRIGKFAEADGGVLFLDEVGELPLDAQVKLLRAIQDGEVDPVGGAGAVATDFRLISATNRVLRGEVAAGRFREDLYYRISVYPMTLPPLAERVEDIAPLAERFARRFASQERKPPREISARARRSLEAAAWPGNVRQLENLVHRAVVMAEGPVLSEADFGFGAAPASQSPALIAANPGEAGRGGGDQAGPHPFFNENGHIRPLTEIEAAAVSTALTRYGGAMSEAARRLGIGRSTLYRKTRGDEEPIIA